MIKLENVSYTYDGEINILNHIVYTFNHGKKYTILGKNGEGKTTLIKLIIGLLKPTYGKVIKTNINRISYLPDHNGLYEDLNIIDNVIFRLSLYDESFSSKEKKLNEYLMKYDLDKKKNELIKNLSLGMKKKVALICTFIVDADAYILDEPSGGIDVESKEEIINMINEISMKDNIIICISHDEKIINAVDAKQIKIEKGSLYDVSI